MGAPRPALKEPDYVASVAHRSGDALSRKSGQRGRDRSRQHERVASIRFERTEERGVRAGVTLLFERLTIGVRVAREGVVAMVETCRVAVRIALALVGPRELNDVGDRADVVRVLDQTLQVRRQVYGVSVVDICGDVPTLRSAGRIGLCA